AAAAPGALHATSAQTTPSAHTLTLTHTRSHTHTLINVNMHTDTCMHIIHTHTHTLKERKVIAYIQSIYTVHFDQINQLTLAGIYLFCILSSFQGKAPCVCVCICVCACVDVCVCVL